MTTADWHLRLKMRLSRERLDYEIAAGAPVSGAGARELRAGELTRPGARRALANCLMNILDAAEERGTDRGSPLLVDHEAVTAARKQIADLIALLSSEEPMTPRRLALIRLLATDPKSPIFRRSEARTLDQALAEISGAGQ